MFSFFLTGWADTTDFLVINGNVIVSVAEPRLMAGNMSKKEDLTSDFMVDYIRISVQR